jgi:hypothetical protein
VRSTNNRDYERSPGKIFQWNTSNPPPKGSQNGKRNSKPSLNEINISVKNRKGSNSSATHGVNTSQQDNQAGYSSLIKPLIGGAGRVPQSTKAQNVSLNTQ